MTLCAIRLNDGELRRGKPVAGDVGIPLCGLHRSHIVWFKRLEPPAEYQMPPALELAARDASLKSERMMKKLLAFLVLFILATPALGQQNFPTPNGQVTAITGIASGTTSATATLAAAANKRTYICGFAVSALNTATASSYSATISGLLGGSFAYQGNNGASAGSTISQTFTPCVAANVADSAITVTASDADGSALNAQGLGLSAMTERRDRSSSSRKVYCRGGRSTSRRCRRRRSRRSRGSSRRSCAMRSISWRARA
jgi:hypothetical protein